ncbi:AraC family transcriptional regulator [Sphingomonas sp. KC8]|uniref:AraC family transcriptional regulator n=1 Tax=Sphingomonas sp. KC8 TaxID=1030157 RepID=UPI001E3D6351|nr:AraC family transcriptional regulator [Sphingomonas sp. KC8]
MRGSALGKPGGKPYDQRMSPPLPIALNVRSYGRDSGADRHDFAQLVLPLAGSLAIDIAGREGRLDPCQAAFVDRDTRHSQASDKPNRSLILDFDPATIAPEVVDRLSERPFLPLTPAAGKLIDFMGLLLADGGTHTHTVELWAPLLFDALASALPAQRSRLGILLAAMEAQPGFAWTTATMAMRAGVSVSRLHALFREELDSTPRTYLSRIRLRHVREGLARSDHSIAKLAFRNGYADQSALTRAMRLATGMTPAAYRHLARETVHKKQ